MYMPVCKCSTRWRGGAWPSARSPPHSPPEMSLVKCTYGCIYMDVYIYVCIYIHACMCIFMCACICSDHQRYPQFVHHLPYHAFIECRKCPPSHADTFIQIQFHRLTHIQMHLDILTHIQIHFNTHTLNIFEFHTNTFRYTYTCTYIIHLHKYTYAQYI